MVQSQFSLSWDAYKTNICGGFSSLQQNGEFVDMTLAADGHFVKVHQILMALVSPYLKELITSAPCQHPVIFLNNVTHRTLSSLLEYVYTGETIIPSEHLSSFVEVAKNLHIKGLEDLTAAGDMALKVVENSSTPYMADSDLCHVSGVKRMALPMESGSSGGQVDLPAAARKILVKRQKTSKPKSEPKSIFNDSKDDVHDYSDMMDSSAAVDDDDDYGPSNTGHMPMTTQCISDDSKNSATSNVQYSVSIRGSLQVVLNRYIYNLQSKQQRNDVRRWRCIDYRNNRCMAFLVTRGNVVLSRANLHNHSFHDKKILQKIEKKAIFSALDDVEEYKEKECLNYTGNEKTIEDEDFSTLNFSDTMVDHEKKTGILDTHE